jgi:hypothetical protein
MKNPQAPDSQPRALLIPLDDREALLALRDFERPDGEQADPDAAAPLGGPARRVPKAA